MDKKLQIIQALYGEEAEVRRLLQEDPALWDEYQALCEVKFELDHRNRRRPDPRVLDEIMAAAGGGAVPSGSSGRRDRPARPRRGAARLRTMGITGTVMAVLVIGLGFWMQQDRRPLTMPAAEAPVASEAPGNAAAGTPGRLYAPPETLAPLVGNPAAVVPFTPAQAGRLPALAADTHLAAAPLQRGAPEGLLEMHRRIGRLKESMGPAWEQRGRPLGAFPREVPEHRSSGLQQVRVGW